MRHAQWKKRGLGLPDAVVGCATLVSLLALMTPAINKGQAGVDLRRCQDNLRKLAQAQMTYANTFGGFPPMARAWPGVSAQLPGRGGLYDDHSWYSLVGPYIGEPKWAATLNFTRSMSDDANTAARRGGLQLKIHACPADIGLQRNEWITVWASVRSNYVANAGNRRYGQSWAPSPANTDPLFKGAPFAGGQITPLASITDGLANTLLMSEVWVLPQTAGWGGAYSHTQTSIAGQVFTSWNTPNSTLRDEIGRGLYGGLSTVGMQNLWLQMGFTAENWPILAAGGNSEHRTTRISPRSNHPGGVNVSMCNGAIGFITDDIDPQIWTAISTAWGAEVP
jgi:hypothetical protein